MSVSKTQKNKSVGHFAGEHGELSKAVFGESYTAAYAYKKTQRLASAVYLVTGHINAQDPLRCALREKCLVPLTLLVARSAEGDGRHAHAASLIPTILEITSYLELAHSAGLISEMNAAVITREYMSLASLIESRGGQLVREPEVADHFFNVVDEPAPAAAKRHDTDKTKADAGRQPSRTSKEPKGQLSDKQDDSAQKDDTKTSSGASATPSARRDIIVDIVRKKGRVNVKDISAVIVECSEKTLQRELLALVSEGVLKKEGERRWSTYVISG